MLQLIAQIFWKRSGLIFFALSLGIPCVTIDDLDILTVITLLVVFHFTLQPPYSEKVI
jgi:hypothetical protein